MTQFSRLLVLIVFAFAVLAGAEPPRLVVQTTQPRTSGRVAISPDHGMLATADQDGIVNVWSVASGLLLRSLDLDMNIKAIAFDPLGRLAVGGEDRVEFYDAATGIKLGALDADPIHVTCFDFSGDQAFTGDRAASVIAWDLSSGKKSKVIATLTNVVISVRLAPGGKTLAALSQDGIVTLFSMPGAKKLGTITGFARDTNIDFSGDGNRFAGRAQDGTVKLVSVNPRKEYGFLPAPLGNVVVSFGPESSVYYRTEDGIGRFSAASRTQEDSAFRKITPSDDFRVIGDRKFAAAARPDQSIELYDLASEKLVQTFRGVTGAVSALATSKGYCATGSDDGYLHLWDPLTGHPLASVMAHPGGVTAVAFSPDGSKLYSVGADGAFQTWKLPNLSPEAPKTVAEHWLRAVAVSPIGGKVAVIGYGGDLYAGEATGSLSVVASLGTLGRYATFSPNGKFLAAASGEGDLLMASVDGSSAPVVIKGANARPITYLCFAGDGKHLLTAGKDGVVKLWESGASKPMATLQLPSSVFCGSVSPDGKTVVLGGWVQGAVFVDLDTGEKVGELPTESRNIRAIAYSADGKNVFTGGRDGATRVWDVPKKSLVASRYAIAVKQWVVVDPKGRFDGTDQGLKALHWVQDQNTIPLDAFFEQFFVPQLYASSMGVKLMGADPVKAPPVVKVDITQKILPPPRVQITTPTSDQTSDKEQTTIEVKVFDQGGGIDQISLYQNGKLVSNEQRALVEMTRTSDNAIVKKFDVLLSPGENIFRATAFNKDRTETAAPQQVKITLNAATAAATLYVLSVGINDYVNDAYDLGFAKPDSIAIATDLKARSATIFKDVVVEQIVDKLATKANLEAAFARIKAKARPGDAFVFFYSGHGIVTEPDDGTQGEFYMVMSDVKKMIGTDDLAKLGMSASRLKELCMAIPAQKQLIIFDACYSGGAVSAFKSRGAAEEKAIHQLSRSTGIAVLAAASPAQTATEIQSLGHGVFTYAILQGFAGAAAPGSGSRKVSVGQLFSYLNDVVPDLTKKYRGISQIPDTYLSGQDFPIVITKG